MKKGGDGRAGDPYMYIHMHMHMHIYICICVCVYVCVDMCNQELLTLDCSIMS